MPEIKKATEFWWQGTKQAILWQMEPSQVGKVTEFRCDGAKKVEPREIQCYDPAMVQAPQAARHAAPLAYRNGLVAPRCQCP